ncbi:GrpB family protein [Sporosarcina trichiuri]|uniref:GrpB family protein n=1 Tax=Sporosarcina trichiuri TaxID=3056445 RepID=UPI0025B39D34|nr:GrpB family protein [Sporosarcina sp. 0.2-SM1T-5]WJY27230.1 GrpB family protein [Sporosarcina sp. 0.2-SM1T-5]
MRLGLKRDEVRLESYTSEWEAEFNSVKREIQACTGLDAHHIEHIGSTAIKGMTAKPIVDIMIGIDALQDVDKPLLTKFTGAGFLRLKVERPGEIVLAKFADDICEVKTHFIHLVEYQQDLWHNLLFFRNYLNDNADARQQYLAIKQEYLTTSSSGIKAYTDFKESFVKEIIAKRMEYAHSEEIESRN